MERICVRVSPVRTWSVRRAWAGKGRGGNGGSWEGMNCEKGEAWSVLWIIKVERLMVSAAMSDR